MYRSVLALLFAAVLLLSGCAAERQHIPREKDTQGTDMAGQSSDMSGEEGMYMDTTENVIYLAGGCFWGMEQLMQSIPGVIPTAPARRTPPTRPSARATPASGRPFGWSMTLSR